MRLAGLEPGNTVEAMLAVQMAAIHRATISAALRVRKGGDLESAQFNAKTLNNLTRTFAAQAETMKKLRGTGEQKVTVWHRHYHLAAGALAPGSQAVLGDVSGGGGKRNRSNNPMNTQFGHGVRADNNEAFSWYQRAAAAGYPLGQYDLAAAFEFGRGTDTDFAEAERWYLRASEGGLGLAATALQRVRKSRADALPRAYEVALEEQGGTFVVPVLINGVIVLDVIVDSGASDVSIPADVVMTLMRAGSISDDDFTGKKDYVLADGSTISSDTFLINSLKVTLKTAQYQQRATT